MKLKDLKNYINNIGSDRDEYEVELILSDLYWNTTTRLKIKDMFVSDIESSKILDIHLIG